MKARRALRLISLVMLIVAAVFVFCALSNPALGKTIYIGSFVFGAEQWRFCYKVYAIVMVGLFVTSFFVKEKKQTNSLFDEPNTTTKYKRTDR